MDKEEYLGIKECCETQIKKLQKTLKELDERYVNDNKPFNIGEKVRLRGFDRGIEKPLFERDAYVCGFVVCFGDIYPKFNDVKKDGTMSSKRFRPLSLCERLEYVGYNNQIDTSKIQGRFKYE